MKRPFNSTNFDHLVLRVQDVERSIRFYEDVVGCSVDRRRPELGLYHLRCGEIMIDLVDLKGPLGRTGSLADHGTGNVDHFCLRIEPFDEAALHSFLKLHGIEAGAAEQRYGATCTALSIYFHDPDGNQVEFKAETLKK